MKPINAKEKEKSSAGDVPVHLEMNPNRTGQCANINNSLDRSDSQLPTQLFPINNGDSTDTPHALEALPSNSDLKDAGFHLFINAMKDELKQNAHVRPRILFLCTWVLILAFLMTH